MFLPADLGFKEPSYFRESRLVRLDCTMRLSKVPLRSAQNQPKISPNIVSFPLFLLSFRIGSLSMKQLGSD